MPFGDYIELKFAITERYFYFKKVSPARRFFDRINYNKQSILVSTKNLGNFGEKIAENYLIKNGYKILDRNYEFRIFGSPLKGEIDIIAKKNDIISFVEVKTLQQTQGGSFLPEDKVDFQKQRKLIKAAESWLMKKKIPLDTQWQIDIIAVEISQDNKAKIRHLENAVY